MINSNIILRNLGKTYLDKLGNKFEVLKNVNAEISKGKITAFLAPQGSGKSSLLKIISGLETHSSGDLINNFVRIIYIPSEPSSFPWLNVKQNIYEANKNLSETEFLNVIKTVGLSGYEEHFPDNKSYGFRFRISIAKALAYQSDFIILDEVFSLMSSESKEESYKLVKQLSKNGQSFILGTSNLTESLLLASEIYLLSSKPGEIIEKIDNNEFFENDLEIMTDERFIQKRNEIENIFKKEYSQIFSKLTV